MLSWIDGSLYPDRAVPATIDLLAERVDFIVRLCGAWDFGVLPSRDTITEIRRPGWREAVDATCLLTSPSYHLVRLWHGLPPQRYLGQQLAYIRDDPSLRFV